MMYSFRSTLTAYYPDDSPMEGGFVDMGGAPLRTLQDFLEGKADYISVAMDRGVFPYGTELCLPELAQAYRKQLIFRVVDTGGAFQGRGLARMDICVRDREASYSDLVNADVIVVAAREPNV